MWSGRGALPAGKVLCVSVVGTVQPEWSIDDLAADYARCARWALDSGADAIETNFSCPNVATCDGQLYQHPQDAARVAALVRDRIGPIPLIVKVGRLGSADDAEALVEALQPFADALAMTNSIAATVCDPAGRLMFAGQKRGICGNAIRRASIDQTRRVAELQRQRGAAMRLIGVGGANSAQHVLDYLDAGAESVHIATAAMVNPALAIDIRRDLARRASAR